jgi:hypothetical protein
LGITQASLVIGLSVVVAERNIHVVVPHAFSCVAAWAGSVVLLGGRPERFVLNLCHLKKDKEPSWASISTA